jgi:hypothetical protein
METRSITQVRIYVLALNTFGIAEEGRIAAISGYYQDLVNLYNSQLLPEPYRDEDGFYHTFNINGPLSRLNPCSNLNLNEVDTFGFGIHDEWINEDHWHSLLNQNQYYIV